MKNYTKAVLYAYPLMKTIGEDYAEHIKNRAVLSYRSDRTAEEIALYLAEEILHKERLQWLKACVERVLGRLSAVERLLVEIRYFGRERKIKKAPVKEENKRTGFGEWSKSKYFRRLRRLSEKAGAMLEAEGLTEERFEAEFAQDDFFKRIYDFVREGRDDAISQSERRWLGI
ncbi:MAG: hypothetical protein IJ514_02285 [Clostridia bacterium]|nr:hypothetical protein [Clostridia bacterium]